MRWRGIEEFDSEHLVVSALALEARRGGPPVSSFDMIASENANFPSCPGVAPDAANLVAKGRRTLVHQTVWRKRSRGVVAQEASFGGGVAPKEVTKEMIPLRCARPLLTTWVRWRKVSSSFSALARDLVHLSVRQEGSKVCSRSRVVPPNP